MSKGPQKSQGGSIRRSQLLTTYGAGSMVDLPKYSVLIGGLEFWRFSGERERIHEPRLERSLKQRLQMEELSLYLPPTPKGNSYQNGKGVETFPFPEWFVAQLSDNEVETTRNGRPGYRSRPLVHARNLRHGKYIGEDGKKKAVVPVRFVQACPNGHLSDLNWHYLAHSEKRNDCNVRGELWLDEGGSGGELKEVHVRCAHCKASYSLGKARVSQHKGGLGYCRGHRPWLGSFSQEACINPKTEKAYENRLLIRSASNAYFSDTIRVISIPEAKEDLKKAIARVYESNLKYVKSFDRLVEERERDNVKHALDGFSSEDVWSELLKVQEGQEEEVISLKQAEFETLLSSPDSVGEDIPDGNFHARRHKPIEAPAWFSEVVDALILVHRLREVVVQVGFTRFSPPIQGFESGDSNVIPNYKALGDEVNWLPAIENLGEGFLLTFSKEKMQEWCGRPGVKAREEQLRDGFLLWRSGQGEALTQEFPGMPYILLHSLSHLLITSVSLSCGYSASSIRERIFAGEYGYGIMLYTGTAGNDGTLGGLVEIGKDLPLHLYKALEGATLCSNDPVCSDHRPNDPLTHSSLQGASCHGCLLIAESSCERFNTYLDRSLVVDTVGAQGAAFFQGILR